MATDYYVRSGCGSNGDGTGSECGSGAGYAWNTWNNINWGSISGPGDTLYIIGTFTTPSYVKVEKGGDSDNDFTVRGDHAAGAGQIGNSGSQHRFYLQYGYVTVYKLTVWDQISSGDVVQYTCSDCEFIAATDEIRDYNKNFSSYYTVGRSYFLVNQSGANNTKSFNPISITDKGTYEEIIVEDGTGIMWHITDAARGVSATFTRYHHVDNVTIDNCTIEKTLYSVPLAMMHCPATDNLVLKNSELDGNDYNFQGAIYYDNDHSYKRPSNITIEGNYIHNVGTRNDHPFVKDNHCIGFQSINGLTLTKNRIEECAAGIVFYHGATADQAAIGDIEISYNYFKNMDFNRHNSTGNSQLPGVAIGFSGGDQGPNNSVPDVIYNVFDGTRDCDQNTSNHDYVCFAIGGKWENGVNIYGNTISGYQWNTRFNQSNTSATIKNNITINPVDDPVANGHVVWSDSDLGTYTEDYNIYYPNDSDSFRYGGTKYNFANYYTNHNQTICSGDGSNCSTADPQLNADYTLSASSTNAINTGLNLGVNYADALDPNSVWPTGIGGGSVSTLDQNDHDSAWEIGAFVFEDNTSHYVTEDGSGDKDGSSYADSMSLSNHNAFNYFDAGDTIYFADTIHGQVVIPSDGTNGNNIVYDEDPSNPATIWGPVTTLDASWTQIVGGNMYYRTINDTGTEFWVGQVYDDNDADQEPDSGENLTLVRGEDHVTLRTRDGVFSTCVGCVLGDRSDGSADNFRSWAEHPSGAAYLQENTVMELMGYDNQVRIVHDGSNGYIRYPDDDTGVGTGAISEWTPTEDTIIFMSWAGKVDGSGDVLQVGIKNQSTGQWLTDADGDGDGVYQTWTSSQNSVAGWEITSTTWTRKFALWKTSSTAGHEYYFVLSASQSDTVYVADVSIIELDLSTREYFGHAGIEEDSGADRVDFFLAVNIGGTPSANEIMYQNVDAAVNADDREYIEIKNLTINGGFIAENSSETAKSTISFNNNTVNFGGSSTQGPAGRFGLGTARWIGAVQIGYDCGNYDCTQPAESANNVYSNISIYDNIIDESLGPALRLYRVGDGVGGDTDEVYGNTITNFCHSNAPWPGGIYATRVDGLDVYENLVHTQAVDGSSSVGGEKTNGIWFDGIAPHVASNCTMRHNLVYGISGTAFYVEAASSSDVFSNVGYDCLWGLKHGGQQDAESVNWYNNIVADINLTNAGNDVDEQDRTPETEAAGILLTDQDTGTITLRNNIVELRSSESDGYYIYATDEIEGTVNQSNNVYYRSGGASTDTNFTWLGTAYNLEDYITQSGDGSGGEGNLNESTSIFHDPKFSDSSNNDYTLADGSICEDSGYTGSSTFDAALDEGSTWPDSVSTTDQDTLGQYWEIGAYGYDPDTRAGSMEMTFR